MTTKITTDRDRTIEVSPYKERIMLDVTNTWTGQMIISGLSQDQAKTLADALDPDRGVETGYALQVDALTRERDALDSRLTRVDMECAEALHELGWSRKDRDGFYEGMREANARADAAEAKVRELEKDRDVWRERAENGEPRPEVTRADIEKVVADWVDDAPEIVNEVWALLSGDDPAVYVVRDSEVAAVPLKHDRNGWDVGQTWYPPLSRGEVKDLLAKEKRAMVRTLAIARAIGVEAEQAADPVEDAAVAAFKAAWHRADEEGDEGNRVRRGIRAAREVLERKETDQ